MALSHTIKLFFKHPLTSKAPFKNLVRFVVWQYFSKIFPFPIVYNFTQKSKLIIEKGMTGATGNLYFGLHEFEDMAFLLHFLRSDDIFLDAGANIGSYTVLASAHIGAYSFAIEPVPITFQKLLNNISINRITEKTETLNIGLGDEKGEIKFTKIVRYS